MRYKDVKYYNHVNRAGECLETMSLNRVWADSCLSLLPDGSRDKYVVECRINGDTLGEIGGDLGVSRERVRQILARGIKTIKKKVGVENEVHSCY